MMVDYFGYSMSQGCSQCSGKKSCGNWHVYAIELRPIVLEKESSFPFEGKLKNNCKIFYVGITTHTVECRYNQHVAKRNKYRKNYTCHCFTEEKKLRKLKKPGRYVNEYRKQGGLSPFYFHHLNPVTKKSELNFKGMASQLKEEAEEAERSLAEELRSEGHAVHFN